MNPPVCITPLVIKEPIYRETGDRSFMGLLEEIRCSVAAEPDLKEVLMAIYKGAFEEYFSMKTARGCIAFCAALAESITCSKFQCDIKALVDESDAL